MGLNKSFSNAINYSFISGFRVIARLVRSSMLEVLRLDYIKTARAKGVSETRVVLSHALRSAIITILPILGLQAGFVLSGSVYIEIVFQWPGIGRMLVDAILTRDIMLVQGGVLFIAYVTYYLISLSIFYNFGLIQGYSENDQFYF
ncbi:MAG: hypothetical protein CM15mP81_04970 [Alphaproteobacteria bacterium]|nr:MAG: hypothetical protein CM15mP81_04970 [Alphaproteobacteria bacterium]